MEPTDRVSWLYGLRQAGIKLGLDNIRTLLRLLGHPERTFPSVLIAGTNGKGSVAAMLHAMLGAAGVAAGLFTSPHLVRPHERVRLGDEDIDDASLQRILGAVSRTIDDGIARGALEAVPSFFEVITATALVAFRERGVRVAVLEVGLGGRLDATNAVDADLAVIVGIDLDHTQTLGDSIESIAAEKGGIVKPGKPLVSGVVRQRAAAVIEAICRERASPCVDASLAMRFVAEGPDGLVFESDRARYSGLRLGLAGRHQIENARVALATFEHLSDRLGLPVEPDRVRRGLAAVRWAGRLQSIESPGGPLLLDGAHNPAGMRTLARYLEQQAGPAPVALIGAMADKPLPAMLELLGPHVAGLVVTRPPVDRAAHPEIVAAVAQRHVRHVEIVDEPASALERARALAGQDRRVVVTGSLYLVGAVLALLGDRSAPGPVSL